MGIVGVTGLPCSGKSLAAGMIASGAVDGRRRALLKADDIGHALLLREDVRAALRARFGGAAADAADPAGMRRAIADRVFADPAELGWLESLIHPLVTEEALAASAAAGGDAVVEAALLFAAGLDAHCEIILLVEADFATRLARAALRGWDKNELRRREQRQIPLFAAAEERAGNILARVDNSGSGGDLRENLRRALEPLHS